MQISFECFADWIFIAEILASDRFGNHNGFRFGKRRLRSASLMGAAASEVDISFIPQRFHRIVHRRFDCLRAHR
jgi:hypothetical protein